MFSKEKCWIKNARGKLMALGKLSEKLYKLDCESQSHKANTASASPEMDAWHLQFSHLGNHTVKQLFSEKLVEGAQLKSLSDISFCEACV